MSGVGPEKTWCAVHCPGGVCPGIKAPRCLWSLSCANGPPSFEPAQRRSSTVLLIVANAEKPRSPAGRFRWTHRLMRSGWVTATRGSSTFRINERANLAWFSKDHPGCNVVTRDATSVSAFASAHVFAPFRISRYIPSN
jgi:hypothetical protein